METLFYISLLTLIYIYVGYPLLVSILSLFVNRKIALDGFEPKVTILIAAHNEEKFIRETIKNKLQQDYPSDKLEIIVISDGSTDSTDSLVLGYADQGVRLIRQKPRAGKTAALNMAVKEAKGEILVFSDANSIYESDAIRKLVRNFSDPTVGYVTGKMIYAPENGSLSGEGCSAYMKYENFLRYYETKLGSVVGVDGGIDAARKTLFRPMKPDQLPDFVLPLSVVEQGYRVVYEPEAILREPTLKTGRDEYSMRVRVSLRALWALWDMKHLFNIFEYGLFSWQLFSHKLLRYLAILFLACALISSAALSLSGSFYLICFCLQIIFYSAAMASCLFPDSIQKMRFFYVPYYFSLINIAAGHALIKFIIGEKQAVWTPRKG